MNWKFAILVGFTFCLGLGAENRMTEVLEGKPLEVQIAITQPNLSSQSIIYENMDPGFSRSIMDRYASYGYTKQTVWIKLDIVNDSKDKEFIVNLGNSHIDRIEMSRKSQSKDQSQIGGDLLAFKDWPVKEYRIAFPIKMNEGERDTFFFRIDTTSTVNFYATIHTPEKFYQSFSSTKLLLGFFYGAISIMVLYNFIIYLMLWDRTYLYYSLAIFSNLLLQIYLNGMDYPYFLGNHPELRNRLSILIVGSSCVFGVQFARHYLQTKNSMSLMDRYMVMLRNTVLVAAPLIFYLAEIRHLIVSSNIVAQLFSISILAIIIRGMMSRNKDAKLYLLAWSLLLVGIVTWTLLEIGVVPYNFFTVYSNQLGSIIEASILSLALAERINTLKQEKQELQAAALVDLEEKVQERTSALNLSLDTIRKDIYMAKRIQEDSIPTKTIQYAHVKFSRLYEPMSIVGGDYFDIFQREKKKYRVFLADATGHGVQAALITMAIRSEYEGLKHKISNPNEILHELNEIFIKDYYSLHIIFSCVVADILISHDEIQFASAGHPDQLLAAGHTIKRLPRTGRIIGLSKDSKYTKSKFHYSVGDRLYLFSDGIVEQKNKEEQSYGEDRLIESLKFMHEYPLVDVPGKLHESLNLYRDRREQEDDLTFLAMERIEEQDD
ncbi:MAG: SpoIIE family protein phosphatase [Leptospiraceae bacterium]|nr:SpoIIE family protein phosphatase [Leptospiraceae bacterium]MCZ8345860.1 SpoIIE family protein phosphatase [Leptospiraceae bacterium]